MIGISEIILRFSSLLFEFCFLVIMIYVSILGVKLGKKVRRKIENVRELNAEVVDLLIVNQKLFFSMVNSLNILKLCCTTSYDDQNALRFREGCKFLDGSW